MHIERRRNLWYAVLVVPPDVRPTLGKFKFIQSLGTPDKRQAQQLAAPVVAKWQAMIRRERGDGDAVTREALKWREMIRAEPDGEMRSEFEDQAVERAKELNEESKDRKAGDLFADIVLGNSTPSDAHYDAWAAQLTLAPKTIDQMKKDVSALVKRFPTLQAITKQSVKTWLDDLAGKEVSHSSRARIVSFCRNYWAYLGTVNAVPAEAQPFAGAVSKKNGKQNGRSSWEPFSPSDVVKLWKEAHKDDPQLAELIQLGAYSGARIEELCALKVSQVTAKSFKIEDAKTAAGIREVPIHSKLRPLVQRLKDASKDDYLLSGLTFNKYRDRSNAIGKRFGRLKTAQGFGPPHVFHSIRKSFVTLLENAGVSENLAADIVGHEKPRITYGLYSGGAKLSVKAAAVERVRYPAGMP